MSVQRVSLPTSAISAMVYKQFRATCGLQIGVREIDS